MRDVQHIRMTITTMGIPTHRAMSSMRASRLSRSLRCTWVRFREAASLNLVETENRQAGIAYETPIRIFVAAAPRDC